MNPRNHKIFSALFAVAFVVIVQWFASPMPVFRFLIPGFLIYVAAIMVYNWRFLKSRGHYNKWLFLRLPIFLIFWFSLLFVIPLGFGRALFLLVSIPVIFFFETLIENTGQQIGWNIFLLSLASLLIGMYGFNFYFPLTGLIYLFLLFVGMALLVRTSVETVPHNTNVKWLAALVLALFSAELFWVLQFLPLHFSVLAVINFNILYLLWAIYYHYLYQTLTARQIQFNILLALGLSIIVLLSSPWSILN
ncbi:hypothetical protein IPM19_02095 [bacterium]|nr:MAG: hypothetical protein IPM19_02095 [bacterium]